MKGYSQLTHLILSFYRENPAELEQLQMLKNCKVYRRWGTLRIECDNASTAEALARAIPIIGEPVAQLRLARGINIMVRGNVLSTLPLISTRLSS